MSTAEQNCKNLELAASAVLGDLIGLNTTLTSKSSLEGFSETGTCSSNSDFCPKIGKYSSILGNLREFFVDVMRGGITDSGFVEIGSFFDNPNAMVYKQTGGSGSIGWFQFFCGTQEVGGCSGSGGGSFVSTSGGILPEVGGGGGCNIGSASLNYGCHQSGFTGITNPADCQTQSNSSSWYTIMSNFKTKLIQCANSGQLTVQGSGGGTASTSSNAILGYGCSFAISVNFAPIVTPSLSPKALATILEPNRTTRYFLETKESVSLITTFSVPLFHQRSDATSSRRYE